MGIASTSGILAVTSKIWDKQDEAKRKREELHDAMLELNRKIYEEELAQGLDRKALMGSVE